MPKPPVKPAPKPDNPVPAPDPTPEPKPDPKPDVPEKPLSEYEKAVKAYEAAVKELKEARAAYDKVVERADSNNRQALDRLVKAREALTAAQEGIGPARERLEAAQEDLKVAQAIADETQQVYQEAAELSARMDEAYQEAVAEHKDAEAAYQAAVNELDNYLSQDTKVDWATLPQVERERIISAMIVEQINEYREQAGLPRLLFSDERSAESAVWSKKQAANGTVSHEGAHIGGYRTENVAMFGGGYYDADTSPEVVARNLFNQWKRSSSHRENMLRAGLVYTGVGVYYDASDNAWYGTQRGYYMRENDGSLYELKSTQDITGVDITKDVEYENPGEFADKPANRLDGEIKALTGYEKDTDPAKEQALRDKVDATQEAQIDAWGKVTSAKDDKDSADADTDAKYEVREQAAADRDAAAGKVADAEKAVEDAKKGVPAAEAEVKAAEDNELAVKTQGESDIQEASNRVSAAEDKADEAKRQLDEAQREDPED